ncbi:hypothetical protein RKD49_005413 [Streptomyces glaucescens]|jgi:hypothetical protein
MTIFRNGSGWMSVGTLVEYYVDEFGRHMARIRLSGVRSGLVSVPVAALIAEVA